MPLYEYECQKCGRHTEKIEKVSGPHLKKCPHCGGKVERMVSRPAIQFKGTGWYVTDYGGKTASPSAESGEKPASAGESKDGAAKDSAAKDTAAKDTKEAKKPEEKKPAKKK